MHHGNTTKREINMLWFLIIFEFQFANYKGTNTHLPGKWLPNQNPRTSHTTSYKNNLERILSWMSSDAATSKGYTYTSIGNNTTVYGLYNCCGDEVGYFCQICVSNAAIEIPQHCPSRVSAMVWYDFCFRKYSNEKFFGKILTHPTWHAVGTKNISNKEETKKGEDFMRSLIRKAIVETSMLHYMDAFNLSFTQSRYGLVECTKDLTNDGCRECLEAMFAEVPKFWNKN